VFLVNRDTSNSAAVKIDISALGSIRVLEALSLWDEDVTAKNTLRQPDRVSPRVNESASLVDGILTIDLPAVSWTAVSLGA
jgi:alpha-N-arabinofuranosidase